MSELEIDIKNYVIKVHYNYEDKVYLAEAPDLKGCITQGLTADQAVRELLIVMETWIESAIECNWDIPKPSKI